MSNQRQGKIARLSAALREEVNLRILDGQPGSKILPWLNAHPEVVRVLEEDFEGLRVSDNNLSVWRKGGYADWLNRRESISRLKEYSGYSVKLAEASAGKLSEGVAAILSGKILEITETIDRISHDPDSDELKDPVKIAATAETLKSLGDTLASLRTGDQNNRRLDHDEQKLELLRDKLKQAQEALNLERQKFMRLTCQKFLDWAKNSAAMEIVGAVATNSEKIAQLGPMMFGELWKEDQPA